MSTDNSDLFINAYRRLFLFLSDQGVLVNQRLDWDTASSFSEQLFGYGAAGVGKQNFQYAVQYTLAREEERNG